MDSVLPCNFIKALDFIYREVIAEKFTYTNVCRTYTEWQNTYKHFMQNNLSKELLKKLKPSSKQLSFQKIHSLGLSNLIKLP